jgi:hypothetical protein
MFSVPKSASILFGIGDEVIQKAILRAQAAAVEPAREYPEEHACRTRRGSGAQAGRDHTDLTGQASSSQRSSVCVGPSRSSPWARTQSSSKYVPA